MWMLANLLSNISIEIILLFFVNHVSQYLDKRKNKFLYNMKTIVIRPNGIPIPIFIDFSNTNVFFLF